MLYTGRSYLRTTPQHVLQFSRFMLRSSNPVSDGWVENVFLLKGPWEHFRLIVPEYEYITQSEQCIMCSKWMQVQTPLGLPFVRSFELRPIWYPVNMDRIPKKMDRILEKRLDLGETISLELFTYIRNHNFFFFFLLFFYFYLSLGLLLF